MENNKEHKISIIVPVYNAEKYLEECLDSLIGQSYKNIEILCVNDGSKDNSLSILEEYAQKDDRIRVFSQANSGPAMARNVGLANANGEYLMFCDSDDTYEMTMCEEMVNAIIENDVDIVMCNTHGYDTNYGDYYWKNNAGKFNIDFNIQSLTNVFLWNKIYKKSLVDKYNIDFPAGHKSDDNYFIQAYVSVAETIYFLNKKLINHFDRENSIMDEYRKNISFEDLSDKSYIMGKFYDFLVENNILDKNIEFFKHRLFMGYIFAWLELPEIWVEQFFDDWFKIINKIKLSRYSDSIVKNKIFLQIKNGNYKQASYNTGKEAYKIFKTCRKKYAKQNDLLPQFKSSNIPIIFNCDNNFVKYLGVTLQSIIDNSSKENNYDIVILNEDISNENKEILQYMVKNLENFSIRFYDMSKLVDEYNVKSWFIINHLNRSAYYRLFIPKIFKNFKKIIYLDADLILKTDISNLFNEDLEEKTIGAVRDFVISFIKEEDELISPFKGLYNYLNENLNIKNIKNYFNSGVILADIEKMKNFFEDFINTAKINNRFFHDQNVLNSVLLNNFKLLDVHWNVQFNGGFSYELEPFYLENAKILHFCSSQKPWTKIGNRTLPDVYWWEYARKTPFYEEILFAHTDVTLNKEAKSLWNGMTDKERNLMDVIKIINCKNKIKFDYLRVKFLSKITFGKTKKHYKEKKARLKKQIRIIREYRY